MALAGIVGVVSGRLSSVFALLACVLLAAPAAAAEVASKAGLRSEYVRGPGAERCPDRAAVIAEVGARLGFNPFSDGGDRVVRCEIVRHGDGLRARIDAWDAAGRSTGARTLTGRRDDCG